MSVCDDLISGGRDLVVHWDLGTLGCCSMHCHAIASTSISRGERVACLLLLVAILVDVLLRVVGCGVKLISCSL